MSKLKEKAIEPPEANVSKKHVTLVGEDHRDMSHLEKVKDLVLSALEKHNVVVLALEQDQSLSITLGQQVNAPSNRPSAEGSRQSGRLQKKQQNTPPQSVDEAIDGAPWVADPKLMTAYKQMLKDISGSLQPAQTVKVIGVDNIQLEAKSDYTTKRDKAMLVNINNALATSEVGAVIYPVGSAHIHAAEDKRLGGRLGSLLYKESNIELHVENLYDLNKSEDAYRVVQSDMDELYKYHYALTIQAERKSKIVMLTTNPKKRDGSTSPPGKPPVKKKYEDDQIKETEKIDKQKEEELQPVAHKDQLQTEQADPSISEPSQTLNSEPLLQPEAFKVPTMKKPASPDKLESSMGKTAAVHTRSSSPTGVNNPGRGPSLS